MSLLIVSSCANKKAEKILKELEEQEDPVYSPIHEESPTNDKLVEENQIVEVTFTNFLSYFPEKDVPYNLQDIKFTSYIEPEFVVEYIDSEYLKKDSLEQIEAETEYDYTPLKYAYAGKMNIKHKHLLAYYQIRENIGPNGYYILAMYDNDGVFLDSLHFDVYKVYLEASDEVIVYNDSIEIKINDKKHSIYIDEQGVF